MRYSGKGLVLFLIFATPVVGQEAGDKARGELRPSSIHFELFPTSTIEGLLTSDLKLETEDGRPAVVLIDTGIVLSELSHRPRISSYDLQTGRVVEVERF